MAQAGISANRLELLQIADAVAREKTIDRQIVIGAMENAIQKAAKSRYGAENDIRASIDAKSGEIKLVRVLTVVDEVGWDEWGHNFAAYSLSHSVRSIHSSASLASQYRYNSSASAPIGASLLTTNIPQCWNSAAA